MYVIGYLQAVTPKLLFFETLGIGFFMFGDTNPGVTTFHFIGATILILLVPVAQDFTIFQLLRTSAWHGHNAYFISLADYAVGYLHTGTPGFIFFGNLAFAFLNPGVTTFHLVGITIIYFSRSSSPSLLSSSFWVHLGNTATMLHLLA